MVQFTPFQVERWMFNNEGNAKYDLAETCALSIPLNELIAWSAEDGEPSLEQSNIFNKKLGYGHITGSPKLRQRIADSYAATAGVTADDILVTQGAIAANFLAVLATVQQGDHVVVVSPSYQQLTELPASFGAQVNLWQLNPGQQWKHNLDELAKLLQKNTALVIINNPNNPTGSLISAKELRAIHDIVRTSAAPGATILCDEVYAPMWHSLDDGEQAPGSLLDLGLDNVLVTGSMSKAFSLAGLRVGWIACRDKNFMERILGIRDYNVISVSGVDDEIAARALGPKTKAKLTARNIALARTNKTLLQEWISKTPGVSWVAPKAGNTALVYLGDGIDDEEFCNYLSREKGVIVVPAGLCFGCPGWVRVGYVNRTEDLEQGLPIVAEALKAWRR